MQSGSRDHAPSARVMRGADERRDLFLSATHDCLASLQPFFSLSARVYIGESFQMNAWIGKFFFVENRAVKLDECLLKFALGSRESM